MPLFFFWIKLATPFGTQICFCADVALRFWSINVNARGFAFFMLVLISLDMVCFGLNTSWLMLTPLLFISGKKEDLLILENTFLVGVFKEERR